MEDRHQGDGPEAAAPGPSKDGGVDAETVEPSPRRDGLGGAGGSDAPPQAAEVDPAIAGELVKLANPRTSWTRNVWVLVLSVVLFYSLGMFDQPLPDALILVAAIFVHELGHLLGMKLFDYRNVQVFFIPFFGAAVSGQNIEAAGWKRALVTLLGPLAGLALSFALFVCWLRTGHRLVGQAALTFVFVNVFNLLPFYPLDGGRFLQEVLFGRNRYVEAVFRVILGGLTALVGVAMGAWLLAALGAFMVLTTGGAFRTSGVARRLGADARFPDSVDPNDASAEVIAATEREIRSAFPAKAAPAVEARRIWDVWEKLNARPPGALGTTVLLLAYLLALVATPVAPAAYALLAREGEIVERSEPGGTTRRAWRVSIDRMPTMETGLNDVGLYDGPHVEYFFGFGGKRELEGRWRNGLPDGEWKLYGQDGRARVVTVFDAGEFVVRREHTADGVIEKKLRALPWHRREALLDIARYGPYGPGNRVGYLPID